MSIKMFSLAVALAMGLLGATTVAKAQVSNGGGAGPGGCGSCGGGTGDVGGAPSPEVNILLGFLTVAGTVAFIKRRRGDKTETADVPA